jgi:hypothetical protein
MIAQRRSQDAARCFCGAVAMPSSRPDCAETLEAYQSDRGVGANPNFSVSLAMDTSGAPSGNRSTTANPPTTLSLARGRRHFTPDCPLRPRISANSLIRNSRSGIALAAPRLRVSIRPEHEKGEGLLYPPLVSAGRTDLHARLASLLLLVCDEHRLDRDSLKVDVDLLGRHLDRHLAKIRAVVVRGAFSHQAYARMTQTGSTQPKQPRQRSATRTMPSCRETTARSGVRAIRGPTCR